VEEYFVYRTIQGEDFTMEVCIDFFNERLKMEKYRGNTRKIIKELESLAKEYTLTKTFIKVNPEDWRHFINQGYITEAFFPKYFNGRHAYSMAFYYESSRRTSDFWIVEDDILLQVKNLPQNVELPPISKQYTLRRAKVEDTPALAELYKAVFEVYPTPVNDPNYLREVLLADTIFYVAEKGGVIVSAASAEVNKEFCNAELTDCATLQAHRKHGLMKILINKLEDDLYQQQIFNVYSIARALSFGMNAVFHQRGYEYTGRLIKNCKIYNKFEDMNIWVKDLSI
jgi:putative beta-lysine N-acetyltransferase